VLKQDRDPEPSRTSEIEGARRLRLDADDVALFSLIGRFLERDPQKQPASRVGEGRVGESTTEPFRAEGYFI
jgi:hypothetical protein